jgi:4-amino-4-deoxy-L-arabinose transferase-like glycosyltransferase
VTRRRAALLALAAAALLTLPLLGARDAWAPDEPRYTEVAQEMLAGGHWWYPQVNGRPYPDKPPLYFWLAAAAGSVRGRVSEGAARLPSALAHLALVALTFHLGRRLLGDRAALVAALVLATTWLEAWMARRACLDVLVSLCAAAAIACVVHAMSSHRDGRDSGDRRQPMAVRPLLAWSAAAGLALGLGFMTKGPVVLIAFACAMLPLLLSAELRRHRPRGVLALGVLAGCAGLAVVLVAWLVPAHAIAGYTPFAIAHRQVLERSVEGIHHRQPPWYFLTTVPFDFLPWTLLVVPAAWAAWKRRGEPVQAMLLGWALLPIAIHSFVVEKRNIYVLPVAPAWALLCGAFVDDAATSRVVRRVSAIAAALLGALAVGAAAAAALPVSAAAHLPPEAADGLALPGVRAMVLLLGALGAGGCALVVLELRRRADSSRLVATIAAATGLVLLGVFLLLPRFDPLKSGRAMGDAVRSATGDAPVAMYPRTWDAYVYYSGRTIADMGEGPEAAAWLAHARRPAYVLAYEKDVPALARATGATTDATVFADDVGHRRVLLLRFDPSEIR